MSQEDEELRELSKKLHASREAGFDSFCLRCQQGFNGPDCPRHWPPTEADTTDADPSLSHWRAIDVYVWFCLRTGATRNKADAQLWMTARDALAAAVKGSTWQ